MGLTDELARLDELHTRGALSDEEFARAKARLLDGAAAPSTSDNAAVNAINALRRSRSDRWLGGVCGGIAAATGIESWVLRLILVVLAFAGGTGVLLYLLLWFFVPNE
jgi:phage shock protein PspC (stress-responsive transcriptional regulator)